MVMYREPRQRAKRHEYAVTQEHILKPQEKSAVLAGIEAIKTLSLERGSRRMAYTAMITKFLLESGLRSCEACRIKMRDLPLRHLRPGLKGRGDGRIIVRHGKGNKERYVELSPQFILELDQFVGRWRRGARPHSPLFESERGGALSYSALRNKVVRCSVLVHVPKLRPHLCRHTHATYLYHITKDIVFVKRQLGHASLSMTNLYTKLLEIDRSEQLSMLYSAATCKTTNVNVQVT